jgi:uncharacterized protein (TIGR03663 family)
MQTTPSMPAREVEHPVAGPNILDRAFLAVVRWDGEKLAWAVLLLVALVSRLVGLGDRVMSHDESLHTVYSWKLYNGEGYQHQPMMHGPLKFVLTAFSYFLFGVNDWSSRLPIALFGVAMVGLLWYMRRWLGRKGAFLAALMFTISPALLFHSRYIRDEVALCALTVLLALCLFRYLETRARKWLVGTAVTLALAFTTMEASFIFGGLFAIYLILQLISRLNRATWGNSAERTNFRRAVILAIPALFVAGLFFLLGKMIPAVVFGALGLLAAAAAIYLVAAAWRSQLHLFAEIDLLVLLGTLVLPFLSAVVLKLFGWQISQFSSPTQLTSDMLLQGGAVLAVLFVVSGLVGYYWLRGAWSLAASLFWAIELLLFTTFLTNGMGVGTGLVGSLGYWIEQQAVMRGGQPWFYFWMLVPLYEFLPLLLTLAAMVAWLLGKNRTLPLVPSCEKPAPAAKGSVPAKVVSALAPADTPADFVSFLVFWVIAIWGTFTYVGEKMPWHVVYFATPMAMLGGWWLGKLVDRIDWNPFKETGGWWLVGLLPVFLMSLKAVLPSGAGRPFASTTLAGLTDSTQWVLALVATLVVAYFLADRVSQMGSRLSWQVAGVTLSGILLVVTIGVSYRFSFINYDYAIEPMVYAHSTPDVRLAMNQLDELSRKTVGDHAIKVAYDSDSTWPLEWYLRDYGNRVFFGDNPSRSALDVPVVIVGDKNLSKVRPYMGDKYYEFNYRLIWWPRETYKEMTPKRIWDGLTDPVQRKKFLDVVLYRRYVLPTAQWDPLHRFSMFVRKDVAAQVWDWGQPAAQAAGAVPAVDPYEQGHKDIPAVQQIGVPGKPGNAPGQFTYPRSVAVAADGTVYVADSGNNRIQVFGADGRFIRQWGSTCKLIDSGQGCQGDGRGQFAEPWGVAVAKDGSVYVADTWNHRVQKFDANGNFITMWGVFESTNGELGKAAAFYGPRQIIVSNEGNIGVMDTGNKRVQVFSPEGKLVGQFGGGGVVDGRFDEPVGLAQDAQGNWYVADTWNHRIQKFDKNYNFVSLFPVAGWPSISVLNKPFLAIDPASNVLYATDPENYRVLAFGLDGTFKLSWGLYGNDAISFSLPTGIAVGPGGKVYVADGDGQRIMVFPGVQ